MRRREPQRMESGEYIVQAGAAACRQRRRRSLDGMSGWCTLCLGGHARQGSCRWSQTHAQAVLLDARNVAKHLVCHFHRHATKVRHKVNTVGMTGNITFTALATRASSQGQHRSTMTAPVGSQIREWLEAVWDTVLQLNLVVC